MPKPNMSKRIVPEVTAHDILTAKCRDPNKCMIKVSTARAIGVPHGYVHVDASGIAITRRKDYREKAFLPNKVKDKMLLFDAGLLPAKDWSFVLTFHKTTRVYKSTKERREQINKARKDKGQKRYGLRERVEGLAVSKDVANAIKNASK